MSSEEQRAHWDLKYEDGLTALTEPDRFFISAYGQFVARSFPNAGVALDLAGGLGRHAREDAGGRLAVSFSLDRVGCGADIGIIGRNDADAPPKPFLPTTMEIGSPPRTPLFMRSGALLSLQLSFYRVPVRRCDHDRLRGTRERIGLESAGLSRARLIPAHDQQTTKEDGGGFHQEQVLALRSHAIATCGFSCRMIFMNEPSFTYAELDLRHGADNQLVHINIVRTITVLAVGRLWAAGLDRPAPEDAGDACAAHSRRPSQSFHHHAICAYLSRYRRVAHWRRSQQGN
jgi:hypothetical protein